MPELAVLERPPITPSPESPRIPPNPLRFARTEVPPLSQKAEEKLDTFNNGEDGQKRSVNLNLRIGSQLEAGSDNPQLAFMLDSAHPTGGRVLVPEDVRNVSPEQRRQAVLMQLNKDNQLVLQVGDGQEVTIRQEDLRANGNLYISLSDDTAVVVAGYNPDTREVQIFKDRPPEQFIPLPIPVPLRAPEPETVREPVPIKKEEPKKVNRLKQLIPLVPLILDMCRGGGPVAPVIPPWGEVAGPPVPPSIIEIADRPAPTIPQAGEVIVPPIEASRPKEDEVWEPNNSLWGTFLDNAVHADMDQISELTGKMVPDRLKEISEELKKEEAASGQPTLATDARIMEGAKLWVDHMTEYYGGGVEGQRKVTTLLNAFREKLENENAGKHVVGELTVKPDENIFGNDEVLVLDAAVKLEENTKIPDIGELIARGAALAQVQAPQQPGVS